MAEACTDSAPSTYADFRCPPVFGQGRLELDHGANVTDSPLFRLGMVAGTQLKAPLRDSPLLSGAL